MGVVQKILFPYLLSAPEGKASATDTAIFFGTDFYNLPIDSDRGLFIERTNQMLAYVRRHFEGHRLLYQPHPNETDEYTLLDMTGFELGKRTISDILLFEEGERIAGVFASCSWAAASAYTFGFRAGVFLDLLKGAIPDEVLVAYRSYFAGFPDSFFIRSFDAELPPSPPRRQEEKARALETIRTTIGDAKKIWFLSSDPAYMVHATLLARELKANQDISVNLVAARGVRWRIVEGSALYKVFDRIISVQRQGYTARPKKIPAVLRNALELWRLPIGPGDVVISFAHAQFTENCILSWYPRAKKILLVENRWYHFSYEGGAEMLPEADFHFSWGVRFYNSVLEPLLCLHKVIYKEFADGKSMNIHRYAKPLASVCDTAFVLTPLPPVEMSAERAK